MPRLSSAGQSNQGRFGNHVVADPRTWPPHSSPPPPPSPRPPMIRRHGPGAAGVAPVPPATVRVPAPAKVNLFLEVLGKRADGYHEIATLLLAIDLADELDFAPDESGGLSLTCDDPALSTGPDN